MPGAGRCRRPLRGRERALPAAPITGWGPAAFLGLLALAAALLSGCGYALVGRASNIPEDVRRVYVEPLENLTARSQVEQFLTRSITDELVTRQRFKVVASRSEADAVLSGTVTAFAVTPVTFDGQGRATEYEIVINARMAFVRRDGDGDPTNDQVIWSNDRYVFREPYEVEVSPEQYFDREDVAIEDAADRFAETMVSDLLEGF